MFASLGFRDVVVVGCCVAVFAVALVQTAEKAHRLEPRRAAEPPFARMANALDVSMERLDRAFRIVGPPSRTPFLPPSDQQFSAHSLKVAAELGLPADRVRAVLQTFRPPLR